MATSTSTSPCSEKSSHHHDGRRFVNLKLYGHWRSSSTWRVQIVLAAKSIPFTFHSIDILTGEPKGTDYSTNVNAMKQIPVLEFVDTDIISRQRSHGSDKDSDSDSDPNGGGDTGIMGKIKISQSMAIIEFLEEAFVENNNNGACSLLPPDVIDRAAVREIAEIVNSGIQPLQNLSVMDMIDEFGKGLVETKLGNGKSFGKYHIEKGLEAIENLVKDRKAMMKNKEGGQGPFAFGMHPTLADAFIVPQMFNARRFFVDLETICPLLLEVEAHCLRHPWFIETHPDAIRRL